MPLIWWPTYGGVWILPPTKKHQSWTPSGKTFWIRACHSFSHWNGSFECPYMFWLRNKKSSNSFVCILLSGGLILHVGIRKLKQHVNLMIWTPCFDCSLFYCDSFFFSKDHIQYSTHTCPESYKKVRYFELNIAVDLNILFFNYNSHQASSATFHVWLRWVSIDDSVIKYWRLYGNIRFSSWQGR